MIRDIALKAARTVSSYSSSVQPATSPYPWSGAGSVTVHDAWNTVDTGGDATGTFAYCWPGNGGEEHLVGFDPGPTLATFNKVLFTFGADYSKTGANHWWFPPDNAFGPRVTPVMLGRDGTTRLYGTAYEFDPGVEDNFVNISTNPDIYKLHTVTWEMTSHPEGGPFLLEDINKLVAGVSITFSNGPNGKAYEVISGSFFKIRIPWFTCVLTVQDLGGYVRSVRHNASATLRMQRKARNTIGLALPAAEAKNEIGEPIHIARFSAPDSAGSGWGENPLERRNGLIVQRTYSPEDLRVVDQVYDLHDFSCEAWGAFRIPLAWTPELSGLAYLDRGGEWTMTRAQDGWSLRPGDGVGLRVLEDYPNLSDEGLAIHSANGEELILNNSNLGGTGWSSVGVTGGLVFSAEDQIPLVEELGYQDSILATFGGTPGSGQKAQAFSLTSGQTISVRVRVRNISIDNPSTKFLEVALVGPTGDYWSEATRAWTSTPTYPAIASDLGFGEVIFDQIPVPATGVYSINVGRFSSTINTAIFAIGLVNVQRNAHGCGMPLVTLGSTITRVADEFVMENTSPYTFWHRDRGVLIAEFRPFWRAASLTAATEKIVAKANHSGGYFEKVAFVAGATDQLVATRTDSGGTQALAVDILDGADAAIHVTRSHYLRLFFRWLGPEGWLDHGPGEVALGYALYQSDGTFVSFHEAVGVWDAPDGATEDNVSFAGLDGWLRWFEVKHKPISGREAIWRR